MTSNSKQKEIQERFKSILSFEDDNDKLEFETSLIHLDIIDNIIELMNERGYTKARLAKKLGTSKSYITQLFSGDKLVNLQLIAKLQRIFDVKFSFNRNIVDDREEYPELPKNVYLMFANVNNKYEREYEQDNISNYKPRYLSNSIITKAI